MSIRSMPLILVLLLASILETAAKPRILSVYSTGVDDQHRLLQGAVVDPHYTLVVNPDPAYPGTNAFVVAPLNPNWAANTETAQWISGDPDQTFLNASQPTSSNSSGFYNYRTTFDLTNWDLNTVEIVANWISDDGTIAVIFNGTTIYTGPPTPVEQIKPLVSRSLTINSGFVAGVNTLEWMILNGPAGGLVTGDSTGLQVDLVGYGCPVSTIKPVIEKHPESLSLALGERAEFSVVSECGSPTFQWRRQGAPIPGATEAVYSIASVSLADAGDYDVIVSNANGGTTSQVAKLIVNDARPRLSLAYRNSEIATVTLNGLAGRRYIVEYADILPAPLEWSVLFDEVLSGPTQTIGDDDSISAKNRFYRARLGE